MQCSDAMQQRLQTHSCCGNAVFIVTVTGACVDRKSSKVQMECCKYSCESRTAVSGESSVVSPGQQ